MILIIDTYNVLHVVGVLPPELAGIDITGLANLLGTSRYAQCRVELICDGTPRDVDVDPGHVHVRYAGPTHQADDLIAALIAESSAPKQLLVVSSDQWVVRQARKRRCRTMSSEGLLRRLASDAAGKATSAKPARPAGRLSQDEVSKWMRFFQVAPQDRDTPAASAPPPSTAPPLKPTRRSTPGRQKADTHGPLPQDVISQAERIWNDGSSA